MVGYNVKTGGDDGASGIGDGNAWATIAKVNTEQTGVLAAGDTISFNGGDTFSDAKLTIGLTGTVGNVITYNSYGTGQATINGASFLHAYHNEGFDYITVDDIKFTDTTGATGADIMRNDAADNLVFSNLTIGPHPTGTNGQGLRIGLNSGGCDTVAITDCTFNGAHDSSCSMTGPNSDNITISGCTFNGGENNGDSLVAQESFNASGGGTISNCTFQWTVAFDPGAENGIDLKRGTWTLSDITVTEARAGAILFHRPGDESGTPATVITVNDCTFGNTNGTIMDIDDNCQVTMNRTIIDHDVALGAYTIRMGGGNSAGELCKLTLNACGFYVGSSSTNQEMFEHRRGDLTANNCTFVMRNGSGSGSRIIHSRSDTTGNTLTVRNSILDADDMWLIQEQASSNWTFDLTDNLYESNGAGATWFSFDGEGPLGESNIGSTVPISDGNSTSGDPLFVSEDSTSVDFFQLSVGTPALNAGDPAFSPTLDLVSLAYNSPPDMGAREFSLPIVPGDIEASFLTNVNILNDGQVDQDITGSILTNISTINDGRIRFNIDIESSILTNTSIFNDGCVSSQFSLEGSLFANTNTFFDGDIFAEASDQPLEGSLFTNTNTFFDGLMIANRFLEGGLFTDADTFFDGQMNAPSNQDIGGSLLTDTDTLSDGKLSFGTRIAAAQITVTSDSENPGAFTIETSREWIAVTISVKGK